MRINAAKIWLPLGLALLALLRLWLVQNEEITGSPTPYDALWYVTSAKYWYWTAPYGWIAFVRPPAYPLWIALVHAIHVPQRLAIDLLQLSSWALFVTMLVRVGLPRWLGLVSFAALSLQPASFFVYDFTLSDNFYAAMLPFLLAGFIAMTFGPVQIYMSILSGVTVAVLWLTRDESPLLVLLSAFWVGLSLCFLRARTGSWFTAWTQLWKPLLTFTAIAATLIIAIYFANLRTFGAFAKSDMASPRFQSLIHALLRLKPSHPERFVSISRENFRRAFEISPTFARLQSELEGQTGELWRGTTFDTVGVKGEIGTGWMMWAIRHAASRTGIHTTPAEAAAFYKQAASEINWAADKKIVPTRYVFGGYLDPFTLSGWQCMPESFVRVIRVFVGQFGVGPMPDDATLRPEERQIYDEMTLRSGNIFRWTPPVRAEAWVGRNYRFFVWCLIACTPIAFGVLAIRSTTPPLAINFVILLLAATIASRVALCTVLDATAFPGDNQRFLIPIMPLFSVMALLIIFQAANALRSKIPTIRS